MNYIKEINSFYDWLETNSVSDSAITLWHALMHINNKAGWKVEFTVASSVLCLKSGLSQSSFKRARNILKQSGRIEWRERKGNQSAIYNLISFAVQYEPQTAPQSGPQSEPQTAPQSEPINKLNLNKTKPSFKKEAKEENIFDQVFDEFFPEGKDPNAEKEKSCAKKESEIVDCFHKECTRLPKIQAISKQRKSSINARINDYGIEKVKEGIKKAGESNFLSGENKNDWKADFDWILKPNNFLKILEGNYDNKKQTNGQSNSNNTNTGFSNHKGNSYGGSKVSGKVSASSILARQAREQFTRNGESGDTTIEAEVVG